MSLQGNDVNEDKKTGYKIDGKEILVTKTRGRPFSGLVKKGMEKGMFPVAKQFEAATLYAATGNFELTSEKTSVPIKYLRQWSVEPWFREILIQFRQENLTKLESSFTRVIDKAMSEIEERLELGDVVMTKGGALVRKPVAIRDLAIVQAINIDKRQLIRGEPTSRSESTSTDSKKVLEDLASKFTAIVNKKRPPVLLEGQAQEITDAEFIDSPSQSNGSSSPQPEVRQEGGSPN
jgi:hypothetical protein